MPIYEEDPWRKQYFQEVACPTDVHIPTDDPDAYRRNPDYRWVYNKLSLAESQGLACAPHGVEPTSYPVFSKPIINLRGMGQGSRTLESREEYLQQQTPGHFLDDAAAWRICQLGCGRDPRRDGVDQAYGRYAAGRRHL